MKKLICFILSLVMICGLMRSVSMAETNDYPVISAGTEIEVSYTNGSDFNYYKFIPEESGWYHYYSTGEKGICGVLADSSLCFYMFSDNYQMYYGQREFYEDFHIVAEFEAGKTYYLCSSGNFDSDVTYGIGIKKLNAAKSIEISNGEKYRWYIGGTIELGIDYTPEYCIPEEITWTSEDAGIADVDSNGVVTLNGLGTTTVWATTANGFSDSIEIEVRDRDEYPLNTEFEYWMTGDEEWYKFIPAEDSEYTLYVKNGSWLGGSFPVYLTITDKNINVLNSIVARNAYSFITCEMKAGETYYLCIDSDTAGCVINGAIIGFIKGGEMSIPVQPPTPASTNTLQPPTPTPAVTSLPWKNGDVDKDDNVTAGDALEVLKYSAKLLELDNTQTLLADLTEDGIIDATDALEILKSAARINEK